jgi:hypothetical protein
MPTTHPTTTPAGHGMPWLFPLWRSHQSLSILLLLAGCQLGGVSAGISSDPVGPTFDTSSLGPPGGGRTGQLYGKSGRARVKADARGDTTADRSDAPSPQRTASNTSPAKTSSNRDLDPLSDPADTSDTSHDRPTAEASRTPARRALPVSAEEPETLGTSPKPRAIRTIPVDESEDFEGSNE